MAITARIVSRSPRCSAHPSPAASTSPSPSHSKISFHGTFATAIVKPNAEYLDRARGYHATDYKKAMHKRQVWVATQRVPGFAEAKEWHGLRRFRRQGLENLTIKRLLIAAGPEPEALVGRDRLGTASCPLRKPAGPSEGVKPTRGRLQVIVDRPEIGMLVT